MASPHQEARLAAASLLLSANPITGARVAQYESEDSLESLVAAGLAAAMEEEEQKKVWQMWASRNARMAAERCYSNTLKALGLLEEFVSEKGQSGKVSEDFTRQELRSCTLEKESSYGEERENEEESYLTDISSQDSCKGNKEDIKDIKSGEENSGE